jgi:hypothetical protein
LAIFSHFLDDFWPFSVILGQFLAILGYFGQFGLFLANLPIFSQFLANLPIICHFSSISSHFLAIFHPFFIQFHQFSHIKPLKKPKNQPSPSRKSEISVLFAMTKPRISATRVRLRRFSRAWAPESWKWGHLECEYGFAGSGFS